MKRKKVIKKQSADIRPLDQRMSQDKTKELRKGIKRNRKVNIHFLEHQCKLPLFGNPYELKT